VGESPLLDGPVHCIPHGVDTAVFKPLDQSHCRELLGVPEGKIVLLCAIEHMDRPLKGADLLVKALDFLPKAFQDQCVLLLFGHPNRRIQEQISLPIIDLGYINEDRLKAVAYSAADLLINPTRAESFGLVALESMACGTPVAAFKVGGIPELVRPGVTGLLAKPDDPEGLAACIQSMAGDPVQLQSMADRCRDVATTEYTLTQQVRRTIELYQYVLSEADPMLFRCK
jgi:glycosyltransferase involved in cell wall biosynthesis